MKKLLLILLCLPMIGFGQTDVSKYIYLNSGIIVSNNKTNTDLSSTFSANFENGSKFHFGIGYNFYNLNNLSFDFEINYLNKYLQLNHKDFHGYTEDGDLAIGENISQAKSDILSFKIKNNIKLLYASSFKIYLILSPRIDFVFPEDYSSSFSSYNNGKGTTQNRSPEFNKVIYLSELGLGIQKALNKIIISSNLMYAISLTDTFKSSSVDEIEMFNDFNKKISINNLVLSISIGKYI
jgi:hypothetical protein